MRFFVLMFLLVLSGCAVHKYSFITAADYDSLSRKYGNVPLKRFILLDEQRYASNPVLPELTSYLQRMNWEQCKPLLEALPEEHAAFNRGLYHFYRREFTDARTYFNSVSDKDCLVQLLLADCTYETQPRAGLTDDIVAAYQDVMNCTDNPYLKEIIKTRIKLIRYGG